MKSLKNMELAKSNGPLSNKEGESFTKGGNVHFWEIISPFL